MPRSTHTPNRSTPATGLPQGRRERNKADVRKRLFRAAIKLFASRGFTATTVEDITRTADVAKGTFFNYFPTKELLLTDFMERRLDILRTARVEAGEAQLPLRDVFRRLLFAIMEEPGRSPAMSRCMLLGALGGEPVQGVVQELMIKGQEVLGEAMAIGQKRGEIRRDRPASELARLFQQSFYGVMYLWALHPNLNLSRCLDATFDLFWAGAEARTGPPMGSSRNSKKRTS